MSGYLVFYKQRTEIGSSYSECVKVIRRIPQNSIMKPLIFNISINDILMVVEKSKTCYFSDGKHCILAVIILISFSKIWNI